MIIKNIEEFGKINESVLSFIIDEINSIFTTKKKKLYNIIKEIEKIEEEKIDNKIKIEMNIYELLKVDSPENRFIIANLIRELNIFYSIKNQEIKSLIKEANKLTEKNYKLKMIFIYELSRINYNVTNKYFNKIKKYKKNTFINKMSQKIDVLKDDLEKKENLYNKYKDKNDILPVEDMLSNLDEETKKILDISIPEFYMNLKVYDTNILNNMYKKLKLFIFKLNEKLNESINIINENIKDSEINKEWELINILKRQKKELINNMLKIRSKTNEKIKLIKNEVKKRINNS